MKRVLCLLVLALTSCSAQRFDVRVDVRTDLRAGIDFSAVVAEMVGDEQTITTEPSLDWRNGVRLALFAQIPPGSYPLVVRVLREDEVVLQRRYEVHVTSDLGVTAIFSSECVEMGCPGEGDDPDATECRGGMCVPPTCFPEQPETCPAPHCLDSRLCSHPCAVGTCVSGSCFYEPRDTNCDVGDACDLFEGCICVDGSSCDADACSLGVRQCTNGGCVATEPKPIGTVCRASAAPCDVPELCDGSLECPPDTFSGECLSEYREPGWYEYAVPDACARVLVRAWGASGGNTFSDEFRGGAGGLAQGAFEVVAGERLTVWVGESPTFIEGGTPGGGDARLQGGGGGQGQGGGGYSGVFRGAEEAPNALLIAGGGGGEGGGIPRDMRSRGADAGGMVGGDGLSPYGGFGGTQTSGGGLRSGAAGSAPATEGGSLQGGTGAGFIHSAGGGGGGWYGGGGGQVGFEFAGGGGGGSSYIAPGVDGSTHTVGTTEWNDDDRSGAGALGNHGAVLIECIE